MWGGHHIHAHCLQLPKQSRGDRAFLLIFAQPTIESTSVALSQCLNCLSVTLSPLTRDLFYLLRLAAPFASALTPCRRTALNFSLCGSSQSHVRCERLRADTRVEIRLSLRSPATVGCNQITLSLFFPRSGLGSNPVVHVRQGRAGFTQL